MNKIEATKFHAGSFCCCKTAEKSSASSGMSEGKVRRLQWSGDSVKAAMKAVTSENMSVSAASRKFKVPRKSLDDRISGNVAQGKKPGLTTVLTPTETP